MSILREQAMICIDETERGLNLRVSTPTPTGEMIEVNFANKDGNLSPEIMRQAISLVSPEKLSNAQLFELANYLSTQTVERVINGKEIKSYGSAIKIVQDDRGITRYQPFDYNALTFGEDGIPVKGCIPADFISLCDNYTTANPLDARITKDGFDRLSGFAYSVQSMEISPDMVEAMTEEVTNENPQVSKIWLEQMGIKDTIKNIIPNMIGEVSATYNNAKGYLSVIKDRLKNDVRALYSGAKYQIDKATNKIIGLAYPENVRETMQEQSQ